MCEMLWNVFVIVWSAWNVIVFLNEKINTTVGKGRHQLLRSCDARAVLASEFPEQSAEPADERL